MSFSKSVMSMLILLGVCSVTMAAEDRLETARAHLREFRYLTAIEVLADADQRETSEERRTVAKALLGVAHFGMHHTGQARHFLMLAIQSSEGTSIERARWTATLAELEAGDGQLTAAERYFDQALRLAQSDPDITTGIRLSRIANIPNERDLPALAALKVPVAAIRDHDDRLSALLLLGTQARLLGPPALQLAFESLDQARELAHEARPRAEALGQLAQLYEDQKRWSEASRLNSEATGLARQIDAHDLLLELEWRSGRLFRLQDQPELALSAFQRAVNHIETIRQDIPVQYREGRSSFRETLAPVYLGLVDLLLANATHLSEDQRLPNLRRARETVELLKQAELDDFLGGRCAVQSAKSPLLDTVAPQTAVIYPIILPDRLELLASVGTELRLFTQRIGAEDLGRLTKRLSRSLRMRRDDSRALSEELYGWLLKPVDPWLRSLNVQTLAVVPDGFLRLIPLATLFDGEHYLIERYAIVTSPGLTLLDSTPLARVGVKALLVGLSEPGGVIDHLPSSFLAELKDGEAVERGSRGRGTRALSLSALADEHSASGTVIQDPEIRQRIKEQLRLPGVAQELDRLQQHLPNTRLIDRDFTAEAFRSRLTGDPFSIVHIASHGVFGHSADSSFIMAYDQVLTLSELESLLRTRPNRDHPIELLTLSACQTAEGDDRAPLGIAGVALSTQVRSALGTLWPVDDEAAARLMPTFYRALTTPNISKAAALREAQLNLLRDKEMAHPFYWSPFILVGNWL